MSQELSFEEERQRSGPTMGARPWRDSSPPGPTPRLRGQPLGLVGQSPAVLRLRHQIERISRRRCTVLIHGESGTGKELAARQIHTSSHRATGPFVAVDCTILSSTLFESQLFGHVKGAFTGADQATIGFFRAAHDGTLFLDEVSELQASVQAKLLRCIQERSVVPLGGVKPIPVNVRVVAATNRDLKQMVEQGTFRDDLYYRLKVVQLHVPPLRERPDDIPDLINDLLMRLARDYDEPVKQFTDKAEAALQAYHWPGNVRELHNAIEHAFVFAEHDRLDIEDLPKEVRTFAIDVRPTGADPIPPFEVNERDLIVRALEATSGNQAAAARLLRINRHRLYRKIRRYGLTPRTKSKGL